MTETKFDVGEYVWMAPYRRHEVVHIIEIGPPEEGQIKSRMVFAEDGPKTISPPSIQYKVIDFEGAECWFEESELRKVERHK